MGSPGRHYSAHGVVTVDLFVASFPSAQWDKILALRNQDTAKARVFRTLLPAR